MSDWIGLVEAAYALEGDLADWLRAVLEAAAPLLDRGNGLAGWIYTLSPSRFQMDDFRVCGGDPRLGAVARALVDGMAPEHQRRLHATPPQGGTLSAKIMGDYPDAAKRFEARAEGLVPDAVGILAPTATGRGAVIAAPLRERRRPTPQERERFASVAAHIGAGLRLRLALEDRAADETTGEAVLDARGRLQHATGGAEPSRAQEALRDAVERRERARTRRERADPEAALALWEGLVGGRWSLIDRFESDGKRFVVAHRNDPDVGDPRGLTQRERQIAEYLGLGRSMKETAYALGITSSAVSNAVKRAATKLGMKGRAELAAFFSPLGLRARLAELEIAGEAFAVGGVPQLGAEAEGVLSDAERDVVLDLLKGTTVETIAARRGRSAATVATQVKAIYEKVGVGSRIELAARLGGA